MVLIIATDVLFDREPAPDQLREAAARAFDVRPGAVAVGLLRETGVTSGLQVVIQRQPEDLPGDFPVWYELTIAEGLLDRITPALDTIVHRLGLVALSDADDGDRMVLHLPDGSDRIVHLSQGEDDSFRLTPALKRTIAAARHHVGNRDRAIAC